LEELKERDRSEELKKKNNFVCDHLFNPDYDKPWLLDANGNRINNNNSNKNQPN